MLIVDMKMPKNCGECDFHRPLYQTSYCLIAKKNCAPHTTRKDWCPLKELVTCGECKHGRNDGARTPYLHNPLVFCELEKSYKPLDWFCADGERKSL